MKIRGISKLIISITTSNREMPTQNLGSVHLQSLSPTTDGFACYYTCKPIL